MAKTKTQFTCQQCGRTAAKALGRCPQCGEWNSMVAESVRSDRSVRSYSSESKPVRLADIDGEVNERIQLPIEEFARVLGGGIVPGSVVLIGGDPGIGKSTLLLQTAIAVASRETVLYISGEESERQIKARAHRLSDQEDASDELYLLAETNLEIIISHLRNLRPTLVVVDSIQTMHHPDLDASAGSISQVRECAHRLQGLAKESGTAVFLVGHVTKEGAIAGPKVMEHIVDTVLYLEGDAYHAYRLLRSVKNRFGATTEVGVFEMREKGMVEVLNPSEAFLAERVRNSPGSSVAATLEGTRPLLVEVQGLTSATSFGHPRRTANGVDMNRLYLVIAVLSRRAGFKLSDQDVFVNVVGGMRINEPAADLAIAAAIGSSVRDRPLPSDVVLVGEIGLSGELRSVPRIRARLNEAEKLGFERALVPKSSREEISKSTNIDLIEVRTINEALHVLLDEKP